MRLLKYLLPWIGSLLMFFVLMEVGLYFIIRYAELPIDPPSCSASQVVKIFWGDINKDFGVWHRPESSFIHTTPCFSVRYTSNSFGARDKERTLRATKERVVVLGDSFVEGYGVARKKRLTDLLESATGIEHLNFGTGGDFGTTQQAILYESLAMQFDHDYVIIGMLPDNDFLDDSIDFGRKIHKTRYRPYYEGKYPDYKIVYFQEKYLDKHPSPFDYLKGYMREFTYSYNAMLYVKMLTAYKSQIGTRNYSGYYDYSPEELLKTRYSIQKIVDLANNYGRQVFLFTIPVYNDFLRSEKARAVAPLHTALSKMSKELGFEYIDLLPFMKKRGGWKDFYHSCDGHWNDYGSEVSSEILLEELSLYKELHTNFVDVKL